MCNISDYFEEVAMEKGMQRGMQKGEYLQLIRLSIAKLRKHKTVAETADTIRRIYEIAENMAPDYDEEKILEQLLPASECIAEEITYR